MPWIRNYLVDTNNEEFLESISQAESDNVSELEILVSIMAKLCYKSFTLGKNANISRVRDIQSNIEAAIRSEHGSVLEHASVSFIVTDCSRIFTHELVRHRAGTAFSQNSGRFIRLDEIDLVCDPLLDPVSDDLAEIVQFLEGKYKVMAEKIGLNNESLSFEAKKKLTSAMRRIAPNGQTNEIGFTMNLRALRFMIMKRTDRAAEWEIRYVFNEIYKILRSTIPTLFSDEEVHTVNGLLEIKFASRT